MGFATLMSTEHKRLHDYASQLARDPQDAADLLQSTMLRCWLNQHAFTPGSSFVSWARAIMKNGFIDDQRRARFKADMPDEDIHELLVSDAQQEWHVHLQEVACLLAELTPTIREAVMLGAEGVSMEEGARKLQITVAAFKSRLHRGRAYLTARQDRVA